MLMKLVSQEEKSKHNVDLQLINLLTIVSDLLN